jgi:hypothetical protein
MWLEGFSRLVHKPWGAAVMRRSTAACCDTSVHVCGRLAAAVSTSVVLMVPVMVGWRDVVWCGVVRWLVGWLVGLLASTLLGQ